MHRKSNWMARCFRLSEKECCSRKKIRLFAWSCGTLEWVLAWHHEESQMSEQRATRLTEAKRVPVEKAIGSKPIGPPPARVNPAPQTQTTSNSSSSGNVTSKSVSGPDRRHPATSPLRPAHGPP